MNPIVLDTVEYTVEAWDINGVFVADISHLLASNLRINRKLNDVDEVAFSIDLVQFEKLCASIGARPLSIIEPYRTDIKIRRNGEYLVGAHVVRTNVNFNSSDTNKLEIQCTGYLNHLKDRLMSKSYEQMTYAQIARNLITDTQAAYNYVRNSSFVEGITGWVNSDAGYILWDKNMGHSGLGSLYTSVTTGPNTFGGTRWQMATTAGLQYTVKFWYRANNATGTIYVQMSNAGTKYNETAITSTNWTYFETTFTAPSNGTSIDIKTSNSVDFWLDEVSISDNIDAPLRRSFGITLGTDYASAGQQADRVRNYDLQNIKDAIINLTKLENDNFDFEFDANKVFTTYPRLGADKPQVELVYPQNITSLSTARDAQTLFNKIFGIGAGIGDERLEVALLDTDSSLVYRVREKTELYNSVEIMNTLVTNTYGALNEQKDMYDDVSATVANNTLDLNDVGLGDAIYVRVDNSSYVDYINGLFRIMSMSIDVSPDMEESVNLVLRKWD